MMLRLKVSFRKRSGSTEKHFLLLLPLAEESILVPRLRTYFFSSSPTGARLFQNCPEVQLVHPQLDIIIKKKPPQTPKSLMPHQLPASRGFLLQNRETIYSGKTRGVVSLARLLEICSQRGKSDGKYCYRRVLSQKKKKKKTQSWWPAELRGEFQQESGWRGNFQKRWQHLKRTRGLKLLLPRHRFFFFSFWKTDATDAF